MLTPAWAPGKSAAGSDHRFGPERAGGTSGRKPAYHCIPYGETGRRVPQDQAAISAKGHRLMPAVMDRERIP